MWASEMGHTDTVELLLEAGADTEAHENVRLIGKGLNFMHVKMPNLWARTRFRVVS